MDYKNNSNTGLIIVADCMLLSVEYIGNVHLFFNIYRHGPRYFNFPFFCI